MASAKKNAPEGPVEVPEIISILPLRNSVLFPGSIIPIDVGRKKKIAMPVMRCSTHDHMPSLPR